MQYLEVCDAVRPIYGSLGVKQLMSRNVTTKETCINPLSAKLNPICHFLAFFAAHHIFHVSRVRVNYDYALCLGSP